MKFIFSIFLVILNIVLFAFSVNFLQNWWKIYNSIVNYIFFSNFWSNITFSFKKDIEKKMDNVVFIWIDRKFLKKTYKNKFDINNLDYYLFIKQINKYKPENIIITDMNLWLLSKDYKKLLNNNSYIENKFDNYKLLKTILLSLKSNIILWYNGTTSYIYILFNRYKSLFLWDTSFVKNSLWLYDGLYVSKIKNQIPLWYKLFLKDNNINNYKIFISGWYYNIKDKDRNIIIREIPIDNSKIKIPLLLNTDDINYYSIYDIITDKNNKLLDKIIGKNVFLWYNIDNLNVNSYLWKLPKTMYYINSYFSIKDNIYYQKISKNIINYYLLFIILFSIVLFLIYKDIKVSLWFTFFSILFSIFLYYIFLKKLWLFLPLWQILIILLGKLYLDFVFWIFNWYIKRKEIIWLFDKYVWDSVLRKKQDWITNISDNKKVFILFSDIESFTNISGNLTPEEVIKMLNIYFYHLWREIEKSWWFIDKYIWDSIMAFWEDEENIDKIFDVLLNILKLHEKINNEIHEKINKNINLRTRIWLHYGDVLIWDVWNISWKISYTIIWDNVNLSSRLEWINKFYNTNIIFSESILDTIKYTRKYNYRLIDKISVKWKKEWIKIYEFIWNYDIYDIKYIRWFEQWIYFYLNWNFKRAYSMFLIIVKLYPDIAKKDKVLQIMLERVESLRRNPPKTWEWIRRYNIK